MLLIADTEDNKNKTREEQSKKNDIMWERENNIKVKHNNDIKWC